MTRPSDTWKHSERTIARMLGLRRVGNTGASTPDAIGEHLVVEVKHRKRSALPGWVRQALAKVRSHAGETKLGLVVLHTEGQRYGDALVVMTLQDFADWYINPTAGASDEELAILAPDLAQAEQAQPQAPQMPANWGTSWDPIHMKR